jgi:TPR repeat protein
MKALPAIILAMLLAGPAFAQSFEVGRSAAQGGDYATALREWQPLAEQGDARSQYSVGVLYERGLGVDADPAQAVSWYQRAAEQDYALAQYNLGALYQQGQGVKPDFVAALKWYRRAAEQGIDKAQ